MANSSSPASWPYGGTPSPMSSTYKLPLIPEPAALFGVMVTLTVADWPGLMVTGANAAAGLTDTCHRSPVGVLTEVSNALVTASIEMVAVPAGAACAYGPHSVGPPSHSPAVTLPPVGA